MTLHIEIQCGLCGSREDIQSRIPTNESVFVKDFERIYRPVGWNWEQNPLKGAGLGNVSICPKCQEKIQEIAQKVEDFKQQMLEEALNPPTPRVERDEEMRKKERVLKANGGFK